MKELKVRINNMELRKCSYLLPESELPEHPGYDIVKYYPNCHYGKEKEYQWSDDGEYAFPSHSPSYRIHKSCFKNPESCFSVAVFEYDDHENFYELRFVGDRPLELDDDEKKDFWNLLEIGDTILNNKHK